MNFKSRVLALTLALSNLLSLGTAVKAEETDAATVIESPKQAQYLLESSGKFPSQTYETRGMPTGWDADFRGGEVTQNNQGYVNILDTSEEYPVIAYHNVEDRSTGKIVFEAGFLFLDVYKGFSIDLMNKNTGKRVASLGIDGGCIAYDEGKKGFKRLVKIEENKQQRYKMIIDFDAKEVELSVDGVLMGTFDFTDDETTINQLRIQTPAEEEMTVKFAVMKITENYLIDEQFFGGFPYDWECISVDEGSVSVKGDHPAAFGATPILTISDSNIIDNTVVRKVFDRSEGNVYTEMRIYHPEKVDGMNIYLKDDEKVAVKLGLDDGNLVDDKGNILTSVSNTMWHILGIEADTRTGIAQIRYNGRDLCQVPFTENAKFIDRLEFATTIKGRSELQVNDIVAYIKYSPEEIPEYPTEPVVPEMIDDDIITSMFICDLWHESHVGWDVITPYPDREPYLGWYDDTKPEVADWEAKWMSEHGVMAAAKCWYNREGAYQGGPLEPVASNSAYNAWFNGEYTDSMKYALLNCAIPAGNNPVGQWRDAFVPVWVEQYFQDPRYLVVDNKPVVYFFAWNWSNLFGSVEACAAEFEYLREEARKAGFDGVYLFAGAHHLVDKEAAKALGFDGCIVYNWGQDTANVDFTIDQHEAQWKMCEPDDVLDLLSVASKGYDTQAWHGGPRSGYAEPEDFQRLLEYLKYDYAERYDEDSPARRFFNFSNWNEWGEGHFMNPSTLHGFGYLDAIRNVFTKGGEHEDTRPSETVKKRTENRYPDERKWLIHIPPTDEPIPTKVLKGWYFNNQADFADWKIDKQIDEIKMVDGNLVGKTVKNDGGILLVNDTSYDINNAPYIKIRMKTNAVDDRIEIFFKTVENDKWIQTQSSLNDITVADEYVDYYFKMDDNKFWYGTFKNLRVDMSSKANTEFAIESIEIIENDEVPISLVIDGEIQKVKGKPTLKDGVTYVETWPHLGYQDKLECSIRYDNETKKVTLNHKDANIIFTLGSDIAVVNGKEVQLAHPIELMNGLPNLPIRLIAEAIGAEIGWDGANRAITLTTKKDVEEEESNYDISTRVPNQWEFEVKDDLEGWQCSTQFYFSRARVKSGQLQLKSMSNDPSMTHTTNFDASKLKTVKVRVKNESSSNVMQIFWASTTTGGISAQNCATMTISTNDEDFVEYTFDLSKNDRWAGTITSLRIDPIGGTGPISFDYIRVEE